MIMEGHGAMLLGFRAVLRDSPKRLPIPSPIFAGNFCKIEVDAVRRNAQRLIQHLADFLRKLAISVSAESADATYIHKGGIAWLAFHQHGRLIECDHDISL